MEEGRRNVDGNERCNEMKCDGKGKGKGEHFIFIELPTDQWNMPRAFFILGFITLDPSHPTMADLPLFLFFTLASYQIPVQANNLQIKLTVNAIF